MGEFDLIAEFFQRPVRHAALGIGDDCALLQPAPGTQWAVSCDMLVAGRHFLPDVDPRTLGHKALAVNLSDLAACGARPVAFTLALALPGADPQWLGPFSQGLFALADAHGCELVGGDTTQGPLNICITVMGEVPVVQGRSQALLRSGAKAGDDVYASGTLGDARLALDCLQGRQAHQPDRGDQHDHQHLDEREAAVRRQCGPHRLSCPRNCLPRSTDGPARWPTRRPAGSSRLRTTPRT